jgi:hypothetical protein
VTTKDEATSSASSLDALGSSIAARAPHHIHLIVVRLLEANEKGAHLDT